MPLTTQQRQHVQKYQRRGVSRRRSERPQVRLARSVCLDANMYSLFEDAGCLYIRVMHFKGKARIIIPLTGQHSIRGTIRLVLDRDKQRIEVHYSAVVARADALTGET